VVAGGDGDVSFSGDSPINNQVAVFSSDSGLIIKKASVENMNLQFSSGIDNENLGAISGLAEIDFEVGANIKIKDSNGDFNDVVYVSYNTANDTPTVLISDTEHGGSDVPSSSSALLELNSTAGALLLSRMNGTGGIENPVNGMLVYNSASNTLNAYIDDSWQVVGPTEGGGGTVTAVTAGTGLNVGDGPGGTINTTGTLNIAPIDGLVPDIYAFPSSITVNAQGQITNIVNGGAPVTVVNGTTGQINSSGGTTPTLSLANVGPGAATYNFPSSITLNSVGQITALGASTPPGTLSSVGIIGSTGLAVTNSPVTGAGGNITLTLGDELQGLSALAANGLVARTSGGTYASRTLSAGSAAITVTNGSGALGNPTVDLPNIGTPGTYNNPNVITTDAYGRVTGVSTSAVSFAPSNATYIVQTANGSLSNEQALGSLATGLLKNTTTTGVLSISSPVTIGGSAGAFTVTGDYYAPGSPTTLYDFAAVASVFVGNGVGSLNVSGQNNIGFGSNVLLNVTSGSQNLGFGRNVLTANPYTYSGNTAIGTNTLRYVQSNNNTGIGNVALFNLDNGNISSGNNTAFGANCMQGGAPVNNLSGNNNSGFGSSSLIALTTGSQNCGFGASSLAAETAGSGNVALGYAAANSFSYTNCVFLGRSTDNSGTGLSNTIVLGDSAVAGVSNACILGSANTLVGIRQNSPTHTLQLGNDDAAKTTTTTWATTSDVRVKSNIALIDNALNKIMKLKPRTYKYTEEFCADIGENPSKMFYGLVADEVEEAEIEGCVTVSNNHVYNGEMHKFYEDLKLKKSEFTEKIAEYKDKYNNEFSKPDKDQRMDLIGRLKPQMEPLKNPVPVIKNLKTLNPHNIFMIHLRATQELNEKLEILESINQDLTDRIASIEAKLL